MRWSISALISMTLAACAAALFGCAGVKPVGGSCVYHTPPPPIPSSADTSVRPLTDDDAFKAIGTLIKDANDFLTLTGWSMDEATVMGGGQLPGVPGYADVHCAQQQPDTLARLVRCAAARIASNKEKATQLICGKPELSRTNVKVLIWDIPFEDEFEPMDSDVGEIGFVTVQTSELPALKNNDKLHDVLRERGSGESQEALRKIRDYYQLLKTYTGPLYFPSGVYVLPESATLVDSFHQKAALSEKEAYVGGIDFVKDAWDTRAHGYPTGKRASSSSMYNPVVGERPVHDSGAFVKGGLIHQLNLALEERAVDTIGSGVNPYGPLIQKLDAQIAAYGRNPGPLASHDRAVFKDVLAYVQLLGSNLVSHWQLPQVASQAEPAYKVDHADFAFTFPKGSIGSRFGSPGRSDGVREDYLDSIDRLDGSLSYAYIENQYFATRDMSFHLYWSCLNFGDCWNRDKFVSVTIPYNPEGVGYYFIDQLPINVVGDIVKEETRNIKWLELLSAHAVLLKDNDEWKQAGAMLGPGLANPDACCQNPTPHIQFPGSGDPANLTLDTPLDLLLWKFSGGQPAYKYCTNVNNQRVQCPLIDAVKCGGQACKVRDVMTAGAIEAFTLASSNAPGNFPGRDGDERLHRFFQETSSVHGGGIYAHSKAAVFNMVDHNKTSRATVGSANLFDRSVGATTSDAEANIFWTSLDSAGGWWHALTDEHSEGKLSQFQDPERKEKWSQYGWENMATLRKGHWPSTNGTRIIRLDVVQRCIKLGHCK